MPRGRRRGRLGSQEADRGNDPGLSRARAHVAGTVRLQDKARQVDRRQVARRALLREDAGDRREPHEALLAAFARSYAGVHRVARKGERRAGSAGQTLDRGPPLRQHEPRSRSAILCRRDRRGHYHRAVALSATLRYRPQLDLHLQGPGGGRPPDRAGARSPLRPRRERAPRRRSAAHHRAAHRCLDQCPSLGRPVRRRPRGRVRAAGSSHGTRRRGDRARALRGRARPDQDEAARQPRCVRLISARARCHTRDDSGAERGGVGICRACAAARARLRGGGGIGRLGLYPARSAGLVRRLGEGESTGHRACSTGDREGRPRCLRACHGRLRGRLSGRRVRGWPERARPRGRPQPEPRHGSLQRRLGAVLSDRRSTPSATSSASSASARARSRCSVSRPASPSRISYWRSSRKP